MPISDPQMSAVIKTIAYFNAVEMPLSISEVYWNLFKSHKSVSLQEVRDTIEELERKRIIAIIRGYVVLSGRQALIDERLRREIYAHKKFRKVKRIIKLLRYIPFIRMVAVCNTMAFDMTRKEGDSDLFIVTKRNRLYLCRLFVTGLLHILGVRRHGLKVENRICLSFYVDEDALDISRFRLAGDDPYLATWTSRVIPVFATAGTYEAFWKTNRKWLIDVLQQPLEYAPIDERKVHDFWLSKVKRGFLEITLFPFAYFLEIAARLLERDHMRHASSRHVRLTDTGVVIDEHTMKFHEEDRRIFYRDRMMQTMSLMQSQL